MKIFRSLPKDLTIYNQYASLRPVTKKIGRVSQFFSFITEFGVIYAIALGIVTPFLPGYANTLSMCIALIGSYAIESMYFGYTPSALHTILYGKHLSMRVFQFILLTGLVGASVTLSMQGSSEVSEVITAEVVEKNTEKEKEQNAEITARIQSNFDKDKQAVEKNKADQIKGIKKKYESKMSGHYANIKTFKDKAFLENTSYRGAIAKESSKIHALKAKRDNEIAAIQEKASHAIVDLLENKNKAIHTADTTLSNAVAAVLKSNNEAKQKRTKQVNTRHNILKYGNLFFVLAFILSCLANVINDKVSNVEIKTKHSAYDSSPALWDEITESISDYVQGAIRKRINKIDHTPTLSTPKPLFRVNNDDQPVIDIEYEVQGEGSVKIPIDLRQKLKAMGYDITRRQIGFDRGNGTDKPKQNGTDKKAGTDNSNTNRTDNNNRPGTDKNGTDNRHTDNRMQPKPIVNISSNTGTDKRSRTDNSKQNGTDTERIRTDKRSCQSCGTDISNKRKDAVFCSTECRKNHWKKTNGRTPYMKQKT